MMWFFAILAVLALAGVALVASGAGSPMAEVHPDRPDPELADGHPVSGSDLRRVRFSTAVRGYRMSEVDALLARLARQLEEAEARQLEQPRSADPSAGNRAAHQPSDAPTDTRRGADDGEQPLG